MKKAAILLTALLLCCGCSEKKQEEDSREEVTTASETEDTPDTGDTVIEAGFREYNESDFQKITVSLTYPDKKPPVEMEHFMLPEYDFGERLAPCKNSEKPGKYFGGDPDEVMEPAPDSIMCNPEKGMIVNACKRDNKIYMLVNYDNVCYYCHEWSIFCYDILTKKMEEVYRNPSDLEKANNRLHNTFFIGNKLVNSYYLESDEAAHEHIELIDLESGKAEDILVVEEEGGYVYSSGDDKLIVFSYDYSELTSSVMEYNIATGEKRYITEDDKADILSVGVSDITGYIVKDNKNNKWNLVTENYSLNTDLIGAEIIYLSDKKAVLAETTMNKVHTFDFEKMEHYVTKLENAVSCVRSFDGNLVIVKETEDNREILRSAYYSGGKGDFYYVIPELGVSYKLAEGLTTGEMRRSGDSLDLCGFGLGYLQLGTEQEMPANNAVSVGIIKNRE